jgi:thioredoxin reductase
MWDVIIIGGGPAGLSAALVLGRARRRVLVCDAGRPRNAVAQKLNGFLTRDGIPPSELLTIARDQLRRYETVERRDAIVTEARKFNRHFTVRLADGSSEKGRKLLFATGVVDQLPDIPGLRELYGRSVFHCPYCDGWEVRDQPLAVYGQETKGVGLAQTVSNWSRDVVLCTDGPASIPRQERAVLARLGIAVRHEKVLRLDGTDGQLKRIVFDTGAELPRRGLFFNTGQYQRSDLPARLGCRINRKGSVEVDEKGRTSVPGVFLAGDASKDVQLAIVAAGEGASAAVAMNGDLILEEKNDQ